MKLNCCCGQLFSASSRWHDTLSPLAPQEDLSSPSKAQVATLKERATRLYSSISPPPAQSKSDAEFFSRIMASGTLSDRLSALVLTVQSSPLHNIRALDSLKAMASKKGREESLKALRAIVDWWVGGGAPPRKLR
jgi:ribosome biogenesis protein MAK21